MDVDREYCIFLSVADPSADDHCANLINALRSEGHTNIRFVGVGGPKMAQAGCELLETTVGRAAMIYKAFTLVVYFWRVLRGIKKYLKDNNVDLVVVCDSPGFNWHVAKLAKKLRIKTLFYVAPQLWAWAPWRIRKLRKRCDKLCCILPFEEHWFAERGIDVAFVGNPMIGAIETAWGRAKQYSRYDPAAPRIAILPGSRQAELKALWEPMQQIGLRIKSNHPRVAFVTIAVDDERRKWLQQNQIPDFQSEYTVGTVCSTVESADFALVASGSATLQVAAMGCPMVVMYQSSRILWHLVGRWLVRTEFLCLVNILAGRELVPEFMPYFSSIEPIVETVERFLADKDKLKRLSTELVDLARPLGERHAGRELASVIIQMLRQ